MITYPGQRGAPTFEALLRQGGSARANWLGIQMDHDLAQAERPAGRIKLRPLAPAGWGDRVAAADSRMAFDDLAAWFAERIVRWR